MRKRRNGKLVVLTDPDPVAEPAAAPELALAESADGLESIDGHELVEGPPPAKLAAIDIGSNSIHLVMVELKADFGYRMLGRDKEMVRLGQGGYGDHRLTPAAMDAAIAALSRFQKLARAKGIETFRAVATSAAREAVNGGDFIERVRRELGLKVKVITGREEGRLVYLAVRHGVDFGNDTVLGLDLGGGSLEIVTGTRERMLRVESFKLGSGRMAELFVKRDPPSPDDLAALERHVRRTLEPVADAFKSDRFTRCIGTSGTIMALWEMCDRAAPQREGGKSDMPGFTRDELADLYRKMSRRTAEARAKMPGADPRRTDQIVAGAAIVLGVMETFGLREMTVSTQALRDGIVVNYLDRHQRGLWARRMFPDPRERTVLHLAERCGYKDTHAGQVARLAVSLFDQLRPVHGLPERSRELLRYAGLLHDIGYLIGQEQHHRHSEYLIRNGGLKGFSPEEIEVLALTVRFHRGAEPKKRDADLRHLPKPVRREVRRLAALLRIAEGLDRTHFSAVDSVLTDVRGDGIVLTVSGGDPELEIWAAARRKDLFESVFDLPLTIVHRV